MKCQIEIKSDIIHRAFEKAFSLGPHYRSNFFHDIRHSFKEEIEDLLIKQGVLVNKESILGCINLPGKVVEVNPIKNRYDEKLGIEFCSKYGYDDFSLRATNYIEKSYCELPSLLPFVKVKEFSIGNVAILVRNEGYDIEINTDNSIKTVGYSLHFSSKKRESYLCLLGVRFEYESMQPIFEKYYKNCNCKNSDLDEIRIVHYPIIFICRKCGQLFTCKCFVNYFDIANDIIRFLPYGGDNELREQCKKIKIRNNICHLCTNNIPKLQYGHEMYFSPFLQKYLPYCHLFLNRDYRKDHSFPSLERDKIKEVENELRKRLGYPKIGEKWISETILFKIVQTLFATKKVICHYRGKELEGLEIDIWIPDLKLGIEYQGEQHFGAVEPWGGEEGLNKRVENDRKKRMLCKKLGYSLIEFQYDEALTIENIESKLRRYLKEE